MPEKYQPSPEEIKKAEEMMTGEEKILSKSREEAFGAGEVSEAKEREHREEVAEVLVKISSIMAIRSNKSTKEAEQEFLKKGGKKEDMPLMIGNVNRQSTVRWAASDLLQSPPQFWRLKEVYKILEELIPTLNGLEEKNAGIERAELELAVNYIRSHQKED